MNVIGTAGHVDHGKTRLIQALTGIDTDRLPEEKARGLTIDLGFAHFDDSSGKKIGVIDVPGHERFIRNMVAGAWGVDCALLVVAGDEGWMRQSNDHARVLAYLKIKQLIVVVTKSDLVDAGAALEIEQDALIRCSEMGDWELSSIIVSAETMDNIDTLKSLIEERLLQLEEAAPTPPFMYVDRVFSVKGSGTVVTGSLMGGQIVKNSQVRILPGSETGRIRSIQSYYQDIDTANPVSRVALNLTGNGLEGISRGSCIAAMDSHFVSAKELILSFSEGRIEASHENAPDSPVLKNHSEIEVATGTGHQLAMVHFIGDSSLLRVIFSHPVPVSWNQRLLIVQHGGSRILGGGSALWLGESSSEERTRLADLNKDSQNHFPNRYVELQTLCTGYAAGEIKSIDPRLTVVGDLLFAKSDLTRWCMEIAEMAGSPSGVAAEAAAKKLKIKESAAKELCRHLCDSKIVENRGNLYYRADRKPEQNLSPFGRKMLADLQGSGKEGVTPGRLSVAGALKEYKNLSRLGLAVSLDGEIFLSLDEYHNIVGSILEKRKAGDNFDIASARDRTGLSRKYLLPLLNRMESDGYVKRNENLRTVLKLP